MTAQTAETPEKSPDAIDVVLTLDQERPKVSVRGSLYSLAILDDFGIRDEHQIKADAEEFDKLWGSKKRLTETQSKRLDQLLQSLFVQLRGDIPDELELDGETKPIPDAWKAKVVLAFWRGPLLIEARLEAKKQAEEEE